MFNSLFCKEIIKHILKKRKVLFREKKKMLNLECYNASLDLPLFFERMRCKNLCHEYNNLRPSNLKDRNKIIAKLFAKVGNIYMIEQPFMCDYGYNIEIGEEFCSNHNLTILDTAKVVFGDNVMVGPNCGFYATTHPLDNKTRQDGIQYPKPIVIKNNVWICGGVQVLGGVTIGENSVICAGSVVNKNIPPNVLAGGNPCKVIKELNLKHIESK